MYVYPNSDYFQLSAPSHPVFKAVEKRFDDWFDNSPSWIQETYVGWGMDEPPVFSKKGAIRQAIENLIEEADESGKPVKIGTFDIECAFT